MLYFTLFKHHMTRMGWLHLLRSKSAVDVATVTKGFLADVGSDVKCFRTDNGNEFVNEIFARLCKGKIIRHEHTGVDGPKHSVVECGLGLIQAPSPLLGGSCYLQERTPQHHGHHGERWFQIAVRAVLQSPAITLALCSPDFAMYTARTSRSPRPNGVTT